MISPEKWLETYDHAGHFCPYYCYNNINDLHVHIGEALGMFPVGERWIDPVAIVEYLAKTYILADRTMVQNISRTPWMARPRGEGWDYAGVPEHGFHRMPAAEIARELKMRLLDEVINYLHGKKQIGILLSGGMDSRILAGIVKELQLRGEWNGQVTAFTWGVKGSRDVEYAQKIAGTFSWEWVHLELTPEVLYNNFFIAAEMGAEFAPHHLHAMQKVIDYKEELDVVLAATYGDSIGRGEFSGTHLIDCQPTLEGRSFYLIKLRDFWLVSSKVYKDVENKVVEDAYGYKNLLNVDNQKHNCVEIELMMHYLRRKLMPAMSYIGMHIPLYQIFTHPRVFGFMWSLDPQIRNDEIYSELLKILPGNLSSIPWARTGKTFGSNEGERDSSSKEHHKYGIWLRHDLHDFIESHVLSETILGLNIFNEKLLKNLVRIWPKAKTISTNKIDEILSWLTSLCIFIRKYNIRSPYGINMQEIKDTLGFLCGSITAWLYQEARERLRE